MSTSLFSGRKQDEGYSHNPLVHTWTLERVAGDTAFRALDRSVDGTRCAVEDYIAGVEAGLFLRLLWDDADDAGFRWKITQPSLGSLDSEIYKP